MMMSCAVDGPKVGIDDGGAPHGTGGYGLGSGDGGVAFPSGSADTSTGSGGDCAAVSSEATANLQPADIIIVVDTSGSMSQEAKWTQANLPSFVQTITASGIDAHVILIADADMCVSQPLGSGTCGCPGGDESLPSYRHVCEHVGSHDALTRVVQAYPKYKDSLRPNATKTIAVISDDDSNLGAAQFLQQMSALDPLFQKLKFDAIVSSADPFDFGSKCFLLSAAEGKIYKELVGQTGGVMGDLCEQKFDAVFQDMATGVINDSQISCEYQIPVPPDGEVINFEKVNVQFVAHPNAQPQTIYYVAGGAAACNSNGGWYYDNPSQPTKLTLCPQSCQAVQGSQDGRVDVLFGCDTEVTVPQ